MSDESVEYLLATQYSGPQKLAARVRLHEKWSVNQGGWHRWVFDHLYSNEPRKVLELGCGSGTLWRANAARIPPDWEITLTDFSAGMVEGAKRNLEGVNAKFEWDVVDIQQIPFADRDFDLVIANHMLYHVPDRPTAFREIARVLKRKGIYVTSTNGAAHMAELEQLLARVVDAYKRDDTASKFGLENGEEQLRAHFSSVTLLRYDDSLQVPESEDILSYVMSTPASTLIDESRFALLKSMIEKEIESRGSFHITKSTGLFKCVLDRTY